MNETREALTASDLAEGLVAKYPEDVASKAAANRLVKYVFAQVMEGVAEGKTVRIAGFGTFESVEQAARVASNPNNPAEKINVPAKTKPRFRAAGGFKAAVAGTGE